MPPVRFEKRLVADERYESAAVFDVDNDGVLDILSGAYWYPGPRFDHKCKVGPVMPSGEYFDEFGIIPMDIDGDGFTDLVTGGWFGCALRWHQNPKGDPAAEWAVHEIAEVGNIEAVQAVDIDGDGRLEVLPNTPGGPQRVFKLVTDGAGRGRGEFRAYSITADATGHGLGYGDIAGNGRVDLVYASGWLEAPEDPLGGEWTWHREFDLGSASCPVIVADVNGDGLSDLIVGQSHAYGLDWWEQRIEGGRRTWVKHPIDPFNSQYHCLWWGDIDGDGQPELVTGKRYRAHCGHDPGGYDNVGIYYFKWTGEGFAKQVIDYGPARVGTGCGIWFQVADLSGDGRPDIVAPGKDGLYLFRNLGVAEPMGD